MAKKVSFAKKGSKGSKGKARPAWVDPFPFGFNIVKKRRRRGFGGGS